MSPTIGAPLLVLLPSDLWRVVPVDHYTHHAQNIPTYGLLYTEGQVTIILSPLSIQFLVGAIDFVLNVLKIAINVCRPELLCSSYCVFIPDLAFAIVFSFVQGL
ncbi:unnamed protein product [Cuscuta epithymum]|uniref:Fatty acid hydroxylase domain-containing protein n=1 Tax=Cuscuta epithymum TaxID=186058 RepID=A0AAV0FI09_9ASTE|nr:unnamed protein product [Cuscuta epithymum]